MSNVLLSRGVDSNSLLRPAVRDSKLRFFALEAVNALGAAFYFSYLFFYLRQEFHLSTQGSLAVASMHGFIYMVMSRWAGQIAQRRGYLATFRLGCVIAAMSLLAGSAFRHSWTGQMLTLLGWTIGICLTWPPLQALVTDRETPAQTAWLVGVYNLVWSGFAGLANFFGGAVYEIFGSGGLFWWPASLSIAMALAASWFLRTTGKERQEDAQSETSIAHESTRELNQRFLSLARIANPFAYVAINTVVPMIPEIARELHLSPTESGWVNSVWFFARWGMFALLWRWIGWHYRMRWMLAAYAGLIAGFLILILAPEIWVLAAGQVLFGVSVGLIYCSSLFYSMDAGNDKGCHGGLHESAIGLGTCIGPALSAGAMMVFPQAHHQAAWAVGALLIVGLVVIVRLGASRAEAASRSLGRKL